MDHYLEFVYNHPVLSVALFIFIYLIFAFEIKNFTKKYKSINCNDLVTKINQNEIVIYDTRDKDLFKKGHIANAVNFNLSDNNNVDHNDIVVYDKDEISSTNSAEKLSKNNKVNVFYLEGGIQSWIDNNFPLVD